MIRSLNSLFACLALFIVCADSNRAAAQAWVLYNSISGEITFDDDRSFDYIGIRVDSLRGELVSSNVTDLDGAITGPFSVINDQSPDFIEWGNLLGFTLGEEVSAGRILPPGLHICDVERNFSFRARSIADPGIDFPLPVFCPEPGTLAPAALGAFFLRRRQRYRPRQTRR